MSSSNEPSKTGGHWDSMMGSVKESVGSSLGAEGLAKSGREQHSEGESKLQAARAQGYTEGTTDRLSGQKDNVIGAVTGDKEQQAKGQAQKEKGQTQQQMNA